MGSRDLDLQHGQLGQLRYAGTPPTWNSQVLSSARGTLQPITSAERYSSSHYASEGLGTLDRNRDHLDEAHFWEDLKRLEPSVVPALHDIRHLCKAEGSPAQEKLSNSSLDGKSLLDTAIVSDTAFGTHQTQRLIAFVDGNSPGILSLVPTSLCRRGWDGDKHTWLECHQPWQANSSTWNPAKGPIRQLSFHSFTRKSSETTLLVIRFESSVVVLRPVLHDRSDTSIPGWSPSRHRPIGFDRRHFPFKFWDIGNDMVDVALRHAERTELASMHSDGQICVWDVSFPRSSEAQPRLLHRGLVGKADKSQKRAKEALKIPGRIFFVSEEAKLAVCSRNMVQTFSLGSAITLDATHEFRDSYGLQDFVAAKQNRWRPSELIIVSGTCVHILFVDVKQKGLAIVHEMARIRHFFDFKQSMPVVEISGSSNGDSLVVLGNRSPIVLHVGFARAEVTDSRHAKITLRPCMLRLPSEIYQQQVASMLLLPCHLRNLPERQPTSAGIGHQQAGHTFWQMFTLDQNGSLSSFVYCKLEPSTHRKSTVRPLVWSTRSKKTNQRKELIGRDSFVVGDASGNEDEDSVETREQEFPRRFTKIFTSGNEEDDFSRYEHLHASKESLYESLIRGDEHDEDIDGYISRHSNTWRATLEETPTPASLLASTNGALPSLRNIEGADQTLKEWLVSALKESYSKAPAPAQHVTVLPMPLLGQYGKMSVSDGGISLASIYQTGVENWVRPLPSTTPGIARLAKERAARYVAISLAVSGIRLERGLEMTTSQSSSGRNASQGTESAAAESQSSTMPSSPPALAHSQGSARSQEPVTPSKPTAEPGADALTAAKHRLSRYATVETHTDTMDDAFRPLLDRLLQAWEPGVDATGPGLPASLMPNMSGSRMDESTRVRQLRRLEKRRQFEARQASAAKRPRIGMAVDGGRPAIPGFGGGIGAAAAAASSPGRTPGVWSSGHESRKADNRLRQQPAQQESAPAAGMESQAGSSQRVGEAGVASQVEPGRHGGRPPMHGLPVRKKPRRPGF